MFSQSFAHHAIFTMGSFSVDRRNYPEHQPFRIFHCCFRLFTVPCFSMRSSRTSAYHYWWPSWLCLAWRWLSNLLKRRGTVWKEGERYREPFPTIFMVSPNARPLGTFKTNYKVAASDGERSFSTILQKNRGLWTVKFILKIPTGQCHHYPSSESSQSQLPEFTSFLLFFFLSLKLFILI